MEFGVQTRGPFRQVLATARWAESAGLTAVALPDHYLVRGDRTSAPAFDHLVHLASLAREVDDLELVSLLSPVTFRHPAVLYKMGVTLDEVSSGRFTMGVGVGWLDSEFELFGIDYPPQKVRYEILEECLAYLRAALSPEVTGFEGAHFRLQAFDPHPRPARLRLLVGGGGAVKTPRLAGLFADEFNITACPPVDFAARIEAARSAAESAGREQRAILVSTAFPALAARRQADYDRLLAAYAEWARTPAERIESVYEQRGYPFGSGSRPAETLASLAEAGCQRAYMQHFVSDVAELDAILEAYVG